MNTIDEIRKYLHENPTFGPTNIQRKFKITAEAAKSYYDYAKFLDEPDDVILNIVNYEEFQRQKAQTECKTDLHQKRIDKERRRNEKRYSNNFDDFDDLFCIC